MRNQQGFVSAVILIAIVLGLIVVGSGAYFVMRQQSLSQTVSENPTNPVKQNEVNQQPASNSATQNSTKSESAANNVLIKIDEFVSKNQQGVYLINDRGSHLILEADTKTFVAVSDEYYKDKDHVFYHLYSEEGGNIVPIEKIDPITFVPFSSTYVKDKNGVYFFRPKWIVKGEPIIMPFADPNTFSVDKIHGTLAKDNKNVYWLPVDTGFEGNNPTVVGADVSTFITIPNGSLLFKDKNHVYSGFNVDAHSMIPMPIVQGANPSTFVSYGPIPDTETQHFDFRGSAYGTDGQSVFYYNHKIDGVDLGTFKIYKRCRDTYLSYDAKDKTHTYCHGKVIE